MEGGESSEDASVSWPNLPFLPNFNKLLMTSYAFFITWPMQGQITWWLRIPKSSQRISSQGMTSPSMKAGCPFIDKTGAIPTNPVDHQSPIDKMQKACRWSSCASGGGGHAASSSSTCRHSVGEEWRGFCERGFTCVGSPTL